VQTFGVIVMLLLLILGAIFMYRVDPNIGAYLYSLGRRVKEKSPKKKKGGKQIAFILGHELEDRLPDGIVECLSRVIRYAGKPQGYETSDWILLQIVFLILGTINFYLMRNKLFLAVMVFAILNMAPFMVIRSKAKKRRFEAREHARRVKRQFRMQILHDVKIDDALKSVAETAPGEFGETFRKYMLRASESLSSAMRGLRDEYGIPELDQFALAIELSEQKTTSELIKELTRQIEDEEHFVKDYLEGRKERLKLGQGGAVFFLALIILGMGGTFAIVGFAHLMSQGGLLG
jgi:hypothetical protein